MDSGKCRAICERHLRRLRGGDEECFIGSIIAIEKEKDERFEVVDGQQRLTTLNMILSKFRDAVDEPAKSDLGRRVLPKDVYTGEEELPRLKLRDRDNAFFRDHVLLSKPVSPSAKESLVTDQDISKLRLAEGLEVVEQFVSGRDQSMLKKMARFLLTRVFVVFVKTESFGSAHRMFNVLNARGMALSNADLIKNMLFERIGPESTRQEDLEESWLEVEERVGLDQFDTFLGHHRTSRLATKSRKALNEEYIPIVRESRSPFDVLEVLNKSAENYVRITDNGFRATNVRAIGSLLRVAFEDWIPPLLAYLNEPVSDLPCGEFIELLEKITYQNWIRRLGYTARLTAYHQIIKSIRAGASADEVRGIFSDNAQNREFLDLLQGDIYRKPFALAVLLRLEEAWQDEFVTKRFEGRITIEHVLPQSMKDSYWQDRFSEDEHRESVHKLGNLVLLSGSKNYKAQYFGFDRKKEIYMGKNQKVSFDSTKEVLDHDEWGMKEIGERQDKLTSMASELWGIVR